MVKVAALLGLVLAGNALAVEVDPKAWIQLASTQSNIEKNDFYGKVGTFEHTKNFTTGVIQQITTDKVSGDVRVKYYKATIDDAACAQGFGKLNYYDLGGKFLFNADFIKDGGSIGASIGDIICQVGAGSPESSRS